MRIKKWYGVVPTKFLLCDYMKISRFTVAVIYDTLDVSDIEVASACKTMSLSISRIV